MNALFRTAGQSSVFVLFCAAGFALGLLSDILHAQSGGGVARILTGLFCGALCALGGAALCLFTTGGAARLYMLAAMIAGGALYFATLGALARMLRRVCLHACACISKHFCACRFVQRLFR